MKIPNLLALAALTALAVGASAQKTSTPPAKTKPAVKKTMPMRDPKTGRFVKKTDSAPLKTHGSTKAHAKGTLKKTLPARDPKTGKFIKKSG